jgi:hypothetical protein
VRNSPSQVFRHGREAVRVRACPRGAWGVAVAMLATQVSCADHNLAGAIEMPRAHAAYIAGVRVLRRSGGRVSWGKARDLIAYDVLGANGYYEIHIMRPDGSEDSCLTCGKPGLPQRHNGQPEWHPSGDYVVFQSEQASHPGRSSEATPGFGRHSDLWIATSDGQHFYPMTQGPRSDGYGVLHPHFSADGKHLSWSEMYGVPETFTHSGAGGYWRLKVADFAVGADGRPALSDVRSYEPGGKALYENHGFSIDGTQLLFSSNYEATKIFQFDAENIYSLELATGHVVKLTGDGYNEHSIVSPNGRKVVWMSSHGNANRGTDYWLMNLDGTDKIRLTNFNDPDNPMSHGDRIICADSDWSADARHLVGYVQTSLFHQRGMVIIIDFTDAINRMAGGVASGE